MTASENTRRLLLAQKKTYPNMQLQDLFKFIYQSAFGCEHLISDPSAMVSYIQKEAETMTPHDGPVVEPLDGDYVRVYLDVLSQGVSAQALGEAFTRSAVHVEEGPARLAEMLQVLQSLTEEGLMGFTPQQLEEALQDWRAAGMGAVHHSPIYEETYRPAYRLVRKDFLKDLGLSSPSTDGC
ncbi:MAG: hypothetical protein HUJ80_07740 [Firmicutes bacterium]|nr:hypothetical protein [Bacillota bacterium]